MRYFDISEFDSPDLKGSGNRMDKTLLSMLDEARHIAQIPFHINSGYRTVLRNAQVGGVANSSHLRGLAVDIRCTDDASRSKIVTSLLKVGFNRIGIAKNFVHCDIDTTKKQNRIFLY